MASLCTPAFGGAECFRSRLDARVDELLDLPPEATTADAERARDLVVLNGLPLAESLARRYRGRGADHEDLLQVARLGLVKAVHRYRANSPSGFSAYATPTITGEIKRYFRDSQWIVRPPRSLVELQQRVVACRLALMEVNGRVPTDREVAEALGLDLQSVASARLSAAAYHPVPDWGLREMASPQEEFDHVLDRVMVHVLLKEVGPRNARLLWLRFMEGRSQASIALELGISQMQVSRLLSALLNRLRAGAEQQATG